MTKYLKSTAMLIAAIVLTGCTAELAPTVAGNDKFVADHVVFSAQDDLVSHIAFGKITCTFDPSGIMHVTVPARATTANDLYVDYRFTYFDENHNPIEIPTGWQTQTLHSDIFEYIQGNSSFPRPAISRSTSGRNNDGRLASGI